MKFGLSLLDLEPDPVGAGDPAGEPAPEPAADPAPEPTPEPAPDYVSRADLDAYLADRDAQQAWQLQQAYPELFSQQAGQPADQPPQLDPFAEDFGTNLAGMIRQAVAEATQPVQQMLHPIADEWQNAQAQQMADQWLNGLQVPEDDAWRTAVLAASRAYETDPYGRPVAPQQALHNAYQLAQQLVQHERAKWEAERSQAEQQHQQHLGSLAGAPRTPGGGAGVEGDAPITDLRQAARAWMERNHAA